MLIVKFRETFQSRYAEWMMAGGMTVFGALMIGNDEAFAQPFYAALKRIFESASALGWLVFLVGIGRLIVLFINGAWQRTPVLRMLGCACGMILFSMMMMSTLSLDRVAPTVSFYAALFMLEMISLRFATNDNIIVSRAMGVPVGGDD